MTSPLPPRLRDSRNLADLVRQQKQNGRQLDSGLLGGRWSPAKPLGATAQLGDVEDDDPLDDDQPAAWNVDQVTATVAGSVSLTLTYVPIDGTLLVFWDGGYLHPSEYVLAGQTVTFADAHVHVGDRLVAAYWYWPSDVEEPEPPPPLSSLTLRGFTADGTLPAATQVGDTIVVAATWADSGSGNVVSVDSRLTAYGLGGDTKSNLWVGRATDLSDPAFTVTAFRSVIAVATFDEAAAVQAAQSDTTSGTVSSLLITPIPDAVAAVAGVMDGHSLVTGSGSLPSPWVLAGTTPVGLVHASIYYWFDADALATPASMASFYGDSGRRTVTVAALETPS